MLVSISAEQRDSLERAGRLLEGQAIGLRATGSKTTVEAIEEYIKTLRSLASANASTPVDIDAKTKVQLEQATFLLEGIRDSLLNADFEDRAEKIQDDIHQVHQIIAAINTALSADFLPPQPGAG